jgi:hypothetical protein
VIWFWIKLLSHSWILETLKYCCQWNFLGSLSNFNYTSERKYDNDEDFIGVTFPNFQYGVRSEDHHILPKQLETFHKLCNLEAFSSQYKRKLFSCFCKRNSVLLQATFDSKKIESFDLTHSLNVIICGDFLLSIIDFFHIQSQRYIPRRFMWKKIVWH